MRVSSVNKNYLFTSESVSEGHPDKVADQISDAVVDALLAQDPRSRVACETMVKTGMVILAGEVTTNAWVDTEELVRKVVCEIGYDHGDIGFDGNTCAVLNAIGKQSSDIAMGVDESDNHEQGAGDQGLMFGYASNETDVLMPAPITYSHRLVERQAQVRKNKTLPWLRPDAKSQVTLEYDDNNNPIRIDAIVVSTQHDDFDTEPKMLAKIRKDIIELLIPRVMKKYPMYKHFFNNKIKYHINPTGKFVIGGPHGDTGLTGRKIIVDTYGGKGAHGGGAFSGKDPSKVDRSAAYATRHIAKNLVAAGLCKEVLVQVSYAIGVAEPMGIFIDTYGTANVKMTDGEIAKKVSQIFDMTPYSIETRLKLRNPIYSETASYGHMGRKNETVTKTFKSPDGKTIKKTVELFTWEKLDYVAKVKTAFKLK